MGFVDNLPTVHAVNSAEQFQVFFDSQVVVKRKLLAHVADITLHQFVLRRHIEASNGRVSVGWLRKSAKHSHGGSLSGTICTEEPENLALIDIERNMVRRDKVAELFREIFRYNDFFIFHHKNLRSCSHFPSTP